MASRIQVGQGQPIYSEREYTAFEIEAKPGYADYNADQDGYWAYVRGEPVKLSLYIDAATGIVVTDIKKYEQSLKEEQ